MKEPVCILAKEPAPSNVEPTIPEPKVSQRKVNNRAESTCVVKDPMISCNKVVVTLGEPLHDFRADNRDTRSCLRPVPIRLKEPLAYQKEVAATQATAHQEETPQVAVKTNEAVIYNSINERKKHLSLRWEETLSKLDQ